MLGTKAQAGVGTLILFIASLLVAAVAAAVFITSGSNFQLKTTTVGKATQDDVSSVFIISDIYATDGSDGTVNYFKQLVKLPPGMPAVHLDYVLLTFGTYNTTAKLTYAGEGSKPTLGNDGYNTWLEEEIGEMGVYTESIAGQVRDDAQTALTIDLDLDGAVDYVVSCRDGSGFCPAIYDGAYMQFNLSTQGLFYIPILDENQQQVSIINKGDGDYLGNFMTEIGTYGYVSLACAENDGGAGSWVIPAGCMSVFLTPTYLAEDLDDDGQDDAIAVLDTELHFFASSRGSVLQQMNDSTGLVFPLGADLSLVPPQTLNTEITLENGATQYGTILIDGDTTRASYLQEDMYIFVTPHQLNLGHYSVQYIQESKNHVEGRIAPGDVVWMFFEAPRDIGEDEEIRITLVPRNGQVSLKEFFMPNIIVKPTISVYH